MSKITTDTIPCMNCGKHLDFKIYNSINNV